MFPSDGATVNPLFANIFVKDFMNRLKDPHKSLTPLYNTITRHWQTASHYIKTNKATSHSHSSSTALASSYHLHNKYTLPVQTFLV